MYFRFQALTKWTIILGAILGVLCLYSSGCDRKKEKYQSERTPKYNRNIEQNINKTPKKIYNRQAIKRKQKTTDDRINKELQQIILLEAIKEIQRRNIKKKLDQENKIEYRTRSKKSYNTEYSVSEYDMPKKSGRQKIGVITHEKLLQDVFNAVSRIEDSELILKTLGNAKYHKNSKRTRLKEIVESVEIIEKYENEVRSLISQNPNLEKALNYLNKNNEYRRMLRKIEKEVENYW